MLLTEATAEAIARGRVTMAFRRWRTLRVKPGTTFRTSLGVVGVTSVEEVDLEDISRGDARQAGFETLAALLDELSQHRDGQLYRIGLRFAGADHRVALRERAQITDAEREQLLTRLTRLGARTPGGPWAMKTLRLIDAHPATRAAKLAEAMGEETLLFKTRVRQLKELGLTESLEVGYRLSSRGRALLDGWGG